MTDIPETRSRLDLRLCTFTGDIVVHLWQAELDIFNLLDPNARRVMLTQEPVVDQLMRLTEAERQALWDKAIRLADHRMQVLFWDAPSLLSEEQTNTMIDILHKHYLLTTNMNVLRMPSSSGVCWRHIFTLQYNH